MFTIYLSQMQFYAYHGVHAEETILGNDFEVNISFSFNETKPIQYLRDTVDYVTIFELVKSHFARPEKLLETLAQNISNDIHKIDNRIHSINITISKKNAPIGNFIGTVGVTYSKSFI